MNKLNNNTPNIAEYLKSYWITSTPETNYPSLNEDIKVDVAIIGGEIVGITAGIIFNKDPILLLQL